MLNKIIESFTYAFMLVLIVIFSLFTQTYMASSYALLTFILCSGAFALRNSKYKHFKVFGLILVGALYIFTLMNTHHIVSWISYDIPLYELFYVIIGFIGGTLAIWYAHFLYQRKQEDSFPIATPIFLGLITLFIILYLVAKAYGQAGSSDIFFLSHIAIYFDGGISTLFGGLFFPIVLALIACITLMHKKHTVIKYVTYILSAVILAGVWIDFPTQMGLIFKFIGEAGLLNGLVIFTLIAMDLGNTITPKLTKKKISAIKGNQPKKTTAKKKPSKKKSSTKTKK